MDDAFLSEEDLDLRNLPWPERVAYWNLWLRQAQATNTRDAAQYSHGVFVLDGMIDPETGRPWSLPTACIPPWPDAASAEGGAR